MRRVVFGITTVVLGSASLALAAPAPAATVASAFHTVALWNMNEHSRPTLVDSSNNRVNGTIGSGVKLNGSYHNFPWVQGGDGGVVAPQHLDLVKSASLNPGTVGFSVTIRLKFTRALGNPLQKGQTGTVGGFYKIQLDDGKGRILCSFVSPTGKASVWSSMAINNGQWHVVTCTRTSTQVSVTVDGKVAGTIKHATGNISNTWPLSIGGKSKCDQVKVYCDYFAGQIDYVRVSSA